MRKTKRNVITKRILAISLTVLMLFSHLPSPSITVVAEGEPGAGTEVESETGSETVVGGEAEEKGVTIKVVDETGNPMVGGAVEYFIYYYVESEVIIIKSNTGEIDQEGLSQVLSTEEYDEYTDKDILISVKVSKGGYRYQALEDVQILSGGKNRIEVNVSEYPELVIEENGGIYDGSPRAGVHVEGYLDGDIVSYSQDGKNWMDEVPEITDAGAYSIYFKVERDGHCYYESGELIATITQAEIEDVNFMTYEGDYDEKEHDIFTNVSGISKSDIVIYTYNGNEYKDASKLPKIENAGEYDVKVKVHRSDNYVEFESSYTAKINQVEIEGINVILENDLIYSGQAQKLVKKVEGIEDDDKVEYSMDNGESWQEANLEKIFKGYTLAGPEGTDVGTYNILIKVSRGDNYKTKEIELNPSTVTISKAYQLIGFVRTDLQVQLTSDDIGDTFDFSASGGSIEAPEITYKVENNGEDDTTDIGDIAEISEDGMLIVKKAGYNIKITATVAGDNNYNPAYVEHGLNIVYKANDMDGELLSFENEELTYLFGANNTISNQKAIKTRRDDSGEISYSALIQEDLNTSLTDAGISIEEASGKIELSDFAKLSDALEQGEGELKVIVTASKTAGVKQSKWGEKKLKTFDSYDKEYSITIKTEAIPEDAYIMEDADKVTINEANGENGWYKTAITIVPASGYTISKEPKPDSFTASLVFNDQGHNEERVVYLKHSGTDTEAGTGGITRKISLPIVDLDSIPPDSNRISIEYSKPNKLIEFLDMIGFRYYNSDATITLTAYDETSGVDSFHWQYIRSEDASLINLEADSGGLKAVQDNVDPTKYTASLTMPRKEAEQLKGSLSVSVKDKAGNESDLKRDTGNVIVVDDISPSQTVEYQPQENGTYQVVDGQDGRTHYFSNDVEFTFSIIEANFFPEDVNISIVKDGDKQEVQDLTWNKASGDTGTQDLHEAKITLSEEATYVVTMEYTDHSGNEMTSYTSDTIIVDKTRPEIQFSYADYKDSGNPQSATISIREQNFRKEDIELITLAKDIAGNEVILEDLEAYLRTCEWTKDGDTQTATISSQFADAIYDLTINYKDLALNPAQELKPPIFIVDHLAPSTSKMSVTYSTPIMETILSNITFGYYNPSVKVTFTAQDDISGVDNFKWTYQRQNQASTTNKASYLEDKLIAVQDSKDKTKFTASVTLPKGEADQLRGHITFNATDKYNNTSEKIADTNHVIVVDTISPTMSVEYTDENQTVGSKMYYNKAVTATFTITEANFYSQDVLVLLSKNGESPRRISPSWTDISTDQYIGTYTIQAPSDHSGDGDYVITINYKDRSSNQMRTYTSDTLVVDTRNPLISVSYADNNPINILEDSEGNQREYFSHTQTATVSITERNFNGNDVDFSVLAQDITGNTLNANSLHSKSSWVSRGDVHTMTISYPGDGNYTFGIAYTDLGTNEAADYPPDYFTVDTSEPTNHSVSYSTSLLDTILSNIAFGFYNAKVIVTLSATDSISSVNNFKYSYANAAGVSSSNAQLLDQVIEEAGIRYSNGGATATTTFEIPRALLGNDNQFNGTVNFDTTDRSGNTTDRSQETRRLVVDNISPTANVDYNAPVQTVDGVSYYDGDITTSVTINEANFYPEDVLISVTRDGQAHSVSPSWTDSSVDIHVGTFSLSGDGDYMISVLYSDKSNNSMAEYTSDQLTIDTKINEPLLTINGEDPDGKAFKDDLILEFSFEDINFESYEISLLRTSYASKNVNVTDQFVKDHINVSENGVSARVDTFDKIAENDGIYTMTISFRDKAGQSIEKTVKFTINRFGSVYEYNDYLISLIAGDGAYVQKIDEDLMIKEYNADRLLSQSLNIEILRDGKPQDSSDIEVSPEINNQVSTGDSGWYQYQYAIKKSNFSGDGVYKIVVSSEDATGNNPENTNYDDKSILFRVDSTPPEINSITGLDSNIINQTSVDVNYTVYDAIGLDSIEVYVDGKEADKITDFSNDSNNYSASFTLSESSEEQRVRLIVTDLAGNVTDTSSEDFTSAYAFNDSVIVSTNALVRWVANKPVFWGSIGVIVAVVILGIVVIVYVRRKKKENE